MSWMPRDLLHKFPSDYQGEEYKKLCPRFSGYPYPGDRWKGSVLCLLIEEGLLLIKRSHGLSSHPGQMAMLGGHREEGEKDPWEVSCREFEEETGLGDVVLNHLGYLPPVYTSNHMMIVPVCGWSDLSLDYIAGHTISNGEWDLLIWVGLKALADEKRWHYGDRFGKESSNSILYFGIEQADHKQLCDLRPASKKNSEPLVLWGATARIVWNFLRLGL